MLQCLDDPALLNKHVVLDRYRQDKRQGRGGIVVLWLLFVLSVGQRWHGGHGRGFLRSALYCYISRVRLVLCWKYIASKKAKYEVINDETSFLPSGCNWQISFVGQLHATYVAVHLVATWSPITKPDSFSCFLLAFFNSQKRPMFANGITPPELITSRCNNALNRPSTALFRWRWGPSYFGHCEQQSMVLVVAISVNVLPTSTVAVCTRKAVSGGGAWVINGTRPPHALVLLVPLFFPNQLVFDPLHCGVGNVSCVQIA